MASRILPKPSVLLVMGVSKERETYASTLRNAGFRTVTTATSVAAYQIAIAKGPDIVVADVHIHGSINGLELTRRLKINACTTIVPVIILTSCSRPQDRELALEAGASMCLERPVSSDMLRDQVARCLGWPDSTSQNASRHQNSGVARSLNVVYQDSVNAIDEDVAISRSAPASKAMADSSLVSHGQVEIAARSCPRCREPLRYQSRWPVLAVRPEVPAGAERRERLRYHCGWFCTNPACDYHELVPV